MTTPNPTASGRTFEDIERRQRELHATELEAVRTLIVVLRELAVALPPESKFPYALADTCKRLTQETVARAEAFGGSPSLSAGLALNDLHREIAQEMRLWTSPKEETTS